MFVSFILASGFRTMYRRHLPALLQRIADGRFDPAAPPAFPAPAEITAKAEQLRREWNQPTQP